MRHRHAASQPGTPSVISEHQEPSDRATARVRSDVWSGEATTPTPIPARLIGDAGRSPVVGLVAGR